MNAVPDRSLDPPAEVPTVAVRAAGNHPYIFKKMVIGAVGGNRPMDGDLVRVVDRDHLPLGFGLWNGRSQIAIRLIVPGTTPPGRDVWAERVRQAVALRRDFLGLDAVTNAYRVSHAEGDGLSGLVVDRYDDVLSVEVFSLGIYQRIGPLLELLGQSLGTQHYRVHVDERIALAEDFQGRPLSSPGLPQKVTITENGVRFRLNFDSGHKTGFFCDQRENRLRLAGFCRDRSVLDVCCYTGGFQVYALGEGGAPGGHLRRPRRERHRDGARERQREPGPAGPGERGRLRVPAADGGQRTELRRGRARPPQVHPDPARHRPRQAEILRHERPGHERGRAGRAAPDLFLLGPAPAADRFVALAPRRGPEEGRAARRRCSRSRAPRRTAVSLDALEGARTSRRSGSGSASVPARDGPGDFDGTASPRAKPSR
ncbi:MAG: class I SAM-dependent methyltransferase [Isosphaeraceae bacterium]